MKKAVVVGAGFIGLEMAENLHELGIQVTVVEMADQVMTPVDFEIAAVVHQQFKDRKVGLLLQEAVAAFCKTENGLQVELKSGKALQADLVILSIGVRPDNRLAKEAAGRGISGRTMFSTVLLLFGIVINLNAQERTKVSFKFQKTTFEQVIQEIQKQTDYDFIYNSKAFPQKSFAIEAQNREVKSILDELSRDLGLEYTIMNKVITLRMKNTPSSSAPQSDQGLRIIKGKVVDEKGEPLPGVSVVVKNTVQGTASDVNGNFTIKPDRQTGDQYSGETQCL